MNQHTGRGLRLAVGLGIGIGLMGGSFVMALFPQPRQMTNAEIMDKARMLGMVHPSDLPSIEPSRASKTLVSIFIRTDMPFREIAQMLKESGVIADVEQFVTLAEQQKVLDRVKSGVHLFTIGDSSGQILEALTR